MTWTETSRRFWRSRNTFVTGATGLLGSWLVKGLLELGANVVILVRDETPRSLLFQAGLDRQLTRVDGSLENHDLLERCLNEYEIDTVFHLGAQTIVGTANRSPLSTFESNIRGTYMLLEAIRCSPLVTRTVVASSDKAYGAQPVLPYDEETPLQGRHPYDVSKSCTDLIAASYHHTYGLPLCITRCGNLFGPGDLNFSRIVPGTIQSLLRNERPLVRSDGSPLRDYFYVEDAALAYLELAEQMDRPEVRGQAYNFSLEQPLNVLELVERIQRVMGHLELVPDVLNEARNEIPAQYLSAARARAVLGWRPRFTLEEGLHRTVAWYAHQCGQSPLCPTPFELTAPEG